MDAIIGTNSQYFYIFILTSKQSIINILGHFIFKKQDLGEIRKKNTFLIFDKIVFTKYFK